MCDLESFRDLIMTVAAREDSVEFSCYDLTTATKINDLNFFVIASSLLHPSTHLSTVRLSIGLPRFRLCVCLAECSMAAPRIEAGSARLVRQSSTPQNSQRSAFSTETNTVTIGEAIT